MERELINYRQNVLPGETISVIEYARGDGVIREAEVHFPDGCDALVLVAAYQNSTRFLPREGYLALNDITRSYPIDRKILQTDELTVEMLNRDAAWPHTITVILLIEHDE